MITHTATPPPTIEANSFRSILRCAAAGVIVITTRCRGELHGMTATAFSSVSADPPTILIVVNRSTRTYPALLASGRFVVNMLSEDQEWLGRHFAGKLEHQFANVDHATTREGIPVLAGCAGHLECVTLQSTDVATHTVVVGRAVDGAAWRRAPLLYHDGSFKMLATF